MDAPDTDPPEASVQGVLSSFGLMLVPDFAQAFSEVPRVVRRGGVLAYATWAPIETNPRTIVLGAATMQGGHFTHQRRQRP